MTAIKTLMIATALMIAASPVTAESFSGRLVDAGGVSPRISSASFTLHIDEYSSDEDVRELTTVLVEEGPAGLEKEMRDLDQGWLRIDGNVGIPVAVARSIESDGGRIVRAVIERPISFFEVWNSSRISDYPMTVLEIRVDENGRGTGTLIAAAQLDIDDRGTLQVESFGQQPFRVLNVRQNES